MQIFKADRISSVGRLAQQNHPDSLFVFVNTSRKIACCLGCEKSVFDTEIKDKIPNADI